MPGPEAGLHALSAVLNNSRQQTEVDTAARHRAAVSRHEKNGNKQSSAILRDPTRSWLAVEVFRRQTPAQLRLASRAVFCCLLETRDNAAPGGFRNHCVAPHELGGRFTKLELQNPQADAGECTLTRRGSDL